MCQRRNQKREQNYLNQIKIKTKPGTKYGIQQNSGEGIIYSYEYLL